MINRSVKTSSFYGDMHLQNFVQHSGFFDVEDEAKIVVAVKGSLGLGDNPVPA